MTSAETKTMGENRNERVRARASVGTLCEFRKTRESAILLRDYEMEQQVIHRAAHLWLRFVAKFDTGALCAVIGYGYTKPTPTKRGEECTFVLQHGRVLAVPEPYDEFFEEIETKKEEKE